jgi:hypothetical protein
MLAVVGDLGHSDGAARSTSRNRLAEGAGNYERRRDLFNPALGAPNEFCTGFRRNSN